MFVYANLIGTWTELTDDDTIEGSNPQNYVNNVLLDPENYSHEHEFVELTVINTKYYIHKSCIQATVTH